MAGAARIRIGNQTAYSAQSVTQPFEYAVANGFDAFEWFSDKKESGGWSESDTSQEMRSYIKNTARSHDILLTVHASSKANPLKAEGLKLLYDAAEFARDVDAPLVNIHFCPDQGTPAFAEAVTPVVKQLAESGIKLSIENTLDTTPEELNELFRLLRKSCGEDAANAGICFDLGHANLCWETRNDYLRFMDQLDPDAPVIHVHMHENYGDYDTHLPLFTGPAGRDASGIRGLVGRLKRRSFSGCIILEQWPIPPGLLNDARNRLMDIIGLPPPPVATGDDFLDRLVEANWQFRSWRNRLGWIHDLLTDISTELTTEKLVYLSIYLRFIGTGEVRCSEEGGHYRPSHHAKMAQKIFDRLMQVATPENAFIIRKIYPWIPSFDSPFIRAEPLTRIRDIAHRNDIPQELKREIKETLQNKLHRSAGPEDLVTSAALLERITAPGASYSPAFVEEFMIFHEELKEFFNAQSLDERLQAILKEEGERLHEFAESEIAETAQLIQDFLAAKERDDSLTHVMTALELLTALRKSLTKMLTGKSGPEAQRLILADIALEDFSFVLLSRLVNYFEGMGEGINWLSALHCISLTIENMQTGGSDAPECLAIESEIHAWSRDFSARERDHLLRLKATLERCRRLADGYTCKILSLYPERALKLGHALRVAEHALRVYAEADIRSNPVFQLSKLTGLLMKNIRALAALPAWDAIVPGKAVGLLERAQTFNDLARSYSEPAIAFVEKAEGDEDIPAGVAGIIIAHETPHLSHLAVRARQGGVVFAACEDESCLSKAADLIGKRASLEVSAEKVTLDFAQGAAVPTGATIKSGVDVPDVILSAARKVLPLNQVTRLNGGKKAVKARRLEELSHAGAGFKTPPGIVIPFGAIEVSLRLSPALGKEYWQLAGRLNHLGGKEFNDALIRLRNIISKLKVPDEIISEISAHFKHDDRLIVRSSSNCEDLEGFSGAGLYESFANVPLSGVAGAICKVWASLWTGRAVSGRKNAGISHLKAHMAVLIQRLIIPEYSFLIHTVNPLTLSRDELYVELAAGLGETLASGQTPGNPYRMVCHKQALTSRMLAFASFSHELVLNSEGGTSRKTIDYSAVRLSIDETFRAGIGKRLAAVGRFVEDKLGAPQDIEGVISGDKIYLVQSRPQQGIA